jgi:hypothetical protein
MDKWMKNGKQLKKHGETWGEYSSIPIIHYCSSWFIIIFLILCEFIGINIPEKHGETWWKLEKAWEKIINYTMMYSIILDLLGCIRIMALIYPWSWIYWGFNRDVLGLM